MPSLSRRALAASVLALGLAGPAAAFPERPITLVVPFAAGGNTDIVARVIAERMSGTLGQRVVVENVAGAGGMTGSDRVARAAPDGHTILLGTISTHVMAPMISRNPPYDPMAAFAPISTVATSPFIVVVHPSVEARNLTELAALVRTRGERINFGSAGVGTTGNMLGAWFNTLSGGTATHVPYRGSGPAIQDLVAGNIQFLFDTVSATVSQVRGGQLRGLAVTMPQRSELLPDVPTSAEAGMPQFVADVWTVLYAPPATPAPIVERLNAAVRGALAEPSVRGRLAELGNFTLGSTPAHARAFMASETAKWRPIVEASGVRTD